MKVKNYVLVMVLFLFNTATILAQEKTITGTVTASEDGMPLPGVNVIVKGTSRGVQTDFDGNYSIKASVGEVLVFSYVGLNTVEISVGASNTVNVELETDNALDEIVVVAYGKEKQANVTSAISVVKSDDIEQVPIASVDQILQGQAAGVNINTGNGQPGASGTMLVRGRSTFDSDVEPLFIMDGIQIDQDNFAAINPNDIASISVLKDASASSLYGNRGANGVVVITTKQGRKGEGVTMQYRTLYGISRRIDPGFNLMNSREYLTYQRDRGIGLGNGLSDAELNAIATQTNTNWRDLFFREGQTMSHEVVFSTGGEKTTTYNSLSYFKQEGITLRSDIQRFNFRNNTSTSIGKLSFSSNLLLGYRTSNFASNQGTGQLDNAFINVYIGQPYLNPFNPDGSLDLTGNGTTNFFNSPIIGLNQARFNEQQLDEFRVTGNVNFGLEVLKNVTANQGIGIDYINQSYFDSVDPRSLRGINGFPNPAAQNRGAQNEGWYRSAQINANTGLTYANLFNDVHDLEFTAFMEYNKTYQDQFAYIGFGIDPKLIGTSDGFTLGTATENGTNFYIPEVYSNLSTVFWDSLDDLIIPSFVNLGNPGTYRIPFYDEGLFSYAAVAKYDYDQRYGVQASIRRDASSRFSKSNRWGTFWSVSAKWNIHNEKFMEGVGFVNDMKLRASYGTTGNKNTTGSQFSTYGRTFGYQGLGGYNVASIQNNELQWETTGQFNIGLDFSVWDRKLSGTFDWYRKETLDNSLLLNAPIPRSSSGFATIPANVGSVRNTGVELSINYDVVDAEDWSWSVNGNIAFNKNEITGLVGDDLIERTRTALSIGDPIGSFYAVRWAGVNPANGSPLYLDLDGNITDTYVASNRVILDKTRDPKYFGGFGTNVRFKQFTLDAFFTYAGEQYRNNGSVGVVEDPSISAFSNMSTSLLREWRNPGDITDIPSPAFGSTRLLLTDRYIEDASFLRLRNVTLAYNFNRDLLEKTKLFTSARIYFQGQNLLTFSKWRGFDPESNLASTFFEFPTPRQYTVGVDINF